MSELKVSGEIVKILDKESGTSKTGKDWVKQSFVLDNKEQYNNLFCFELFGEEKVSNFIKHNKVGGKVDVSFNIGTNEWNGKYYTSLQAWKVWSVKDDAPPVSNEPAPDLNNDEDDNLPF